VRLELRVRAIDAREIGADLLTDEYQPLTARAPSDPCATHTWPLAFHDTTPSIGPGESLADRFLELLRLITTPQPFPARWAGGAQTTIDIDVGEPLVLCDEVPNLSGRVPYRVRSGDGRVDIASEARTYISFTDGRLGAGLFEIHNGSVLPDDGFAESSGISGVDFGVYGAGLWHTALEFDPAGDPGAERRRHGGRDRHRRQRHGHSKLAHQFDRPPHLVTRARGLRPAATCRRVRGLLS
jgi:hypothetical protein